MLLSSVPTFLGATKFTTVLCVRKAFDGSVSGKIRDDAAVCSLQWWYWHERIVGEDYFWSVSGLPPTFLNMKNSAVVISCACARRQYTSIGRSLTQRCSSQTGGEGALANYVKSVRKKIETSPRCHPVAKLRDAFLCRSVGSRLETMTDLPARASWYLCWVLSRNALDKESTH